MNFRAVSLLVVASACTLASGCSKNCPTAPQPIPPGTPPVPDPAEVVGHNPASGASNVLVTTDGILITFSLGLDPSTLSDATINVATASGQASCRFEYATRQVRVRPRQGLMASSTYTVTVTQGVHDSLARPIARGVSWSFSTEPGVSASGIIATNTSWTAAGSPIILTADVQVAYGVTLSIGPGTVIDGRGHQIDTYGTTQAIGAAGNRVRFNNVKLYGGNNQQAQPFALVVQHAEFHGGAVTPSPGYGTVVLRDSRLFDATAPSLWYPTGPCFIERNIFIDCDGIACGALQPVYVTNNVFYRQRTPFAVRAWTQTAPSQFQVTRNSFLSTDRVALEIQPGGYNGQMLATNNYFGTTDAATIADMVYDKSDDLSCNAYIQYEPYLTAPDPATPDPTGLFLVSRVHPSTVNRQQAAMRWGR